MVDPIEVLLKFAFIAVLYLFLLWVARSALKDLRRPIAQEVHDPSVYGAGQPASQARLVVEGGGGLNAGEWFEVAGGITIGRAPSSEVQIEDGFASGHHARLYGRNGNVYIEDMNSTNGTYVNGRRLSEPARLGPDDRIRIGDTEFRLEG
jgi:pSer/pThr/pTyr-binding forkhead associated (FHA) protein